MKGVWGCLRKWIRGCLNSANFSIVVNGRPMGKFGASRRLRQEVPLSPFLLDLVVDGLSRLREKGKDMHKLRGLGE